MVKFLFREGVKRMTSSSNRIIKLRQPIKKVIVLPTDEDGISYAGYDGSSCEMRKKGQKDFVRVSRAELEEQYQEHYNKGFEEGKIEATQQVEAEFREKIESLAGAIEKFDRERKIYFSQNESALVELSLKIAEKIVHEIPEFVPGVIRHSMKSIIEILTSESVVEIFLNPQDLSEFPDLKSVLESSSPNIEKIIIKGDPRISRGGCVVGTENGKIDARLETQLAKLVLELRKSFEILRSKEEINEPVAENRIPD